MNNDQHYLPPAPIGSPDGSVAWVEWFRKLREVAESGQTAYIQLETVTTPALDEKLNKNAADVLGATITFNTLGAFKVGDVTWNGTTVTGTGVLFTENGIVGASNGTPRFVLKNDGSATFAGALSAATGTFAGALSAATGTFAGALSGASGTFTGSLYAATGTFAGSLTAATGTFSGALSAATGTFAGAVSAGSFYTGLTGRRITINYSNDNSIKSYDSAGDLMMYIGGTTGEIYTQSSSGRPGVYTSSSVPDAAIKGINTSGASNGVCIDGYSTAGIGVNGACLNGHGIHGSSSTSYSIYGEGGLGGYISGNLTVTGTISGTVSYATTSGSCTGNAATATNADYSSNAYAVYQPNYFAALQNTDGNFVIKTTGGTLVWSAFGGLSDSKLKDNIVSTSISGVSTLKLLRVVDYKWKKEQPNYKEGKKQTGFIAQEVAEIIPNAVIDIEGTKAINSMELIPYLVKAIQELQDEVTKLKAKG